MSPISKGLASVAVITALSSSAGAQGIVTQKNITLELAQTVANAAIAQCRTMGYKISVTVVDREGLPLVMLRDDGAGLSTPEGSDRKAYTARAFSQPSADFVKRLQDRPELGGLAALQPHPGARRRAADQGRQRNRRRGRRLWHARQGRRLLASGDQQGGRSVEVTALLHPAPRLRGRMMEEQL